MDSEIIKLLQAIDNKLEILNNSQNEIKDSLATMLMAIYDIDFTPSETDNSDIITGLKAVCKLLQEIKNNKASTTTHNKPHDIKEAEYK